MCADIHDGREQNAPFKGPNTDEPDQLSPDRQIRLATHGRSIQMVLISHAGGSNWLVHDGNSGGGLTRDHVRSISGYVIVDPQGSRLATREKL
jgi:hypothetical protein